MVTDPTVSHKLIQNNRVHEGVEGTEGTEGTSIDVVHNEIKDGHFARTVKYHTRPYDYAAQIYIDAGWLAPLPVDFPNGSPVPRGYTGGKNARAFPPSAEKVADWRTGLGHMNIGLWLPRDVIGIDVDAYDDRGGDRTLNWLMYSHVHKSFPRTWSSTSRGPGPSRIYFFRVPSDVADWTSHKSGIDIIRFGHRFARVWPSIKQDKDMSVRGQEYRWYDPSGYVVPPGVVPIVDVDLPLLDSDWIQAFRKQRVYTGRSSRSSKAVGAGNGMVDENGDSVGYGPALSGEQIDEWTARLHVHEIEDNMCAVMQHVLAHYMNGMRGRSGRHDTAKDGVWALLSEGVAGHVGAVAAVDTLGEEFISVVVGDHTRTPHTAAGEWARLVIGAVERIADDVPRPDTIERCMCDRNATYLRNLGFTQTP